MAVRVTKTNYKNFHRDNTLTDPAIDFAIGMSSRKIDALAVAVPTLSAGTLFDAELLLALYFGTTEDRRKTSEGIPPASTTYETISYLDRLKALLGGDNFLILFPPELKRASIRVITPTLT